MAVTLERIREARERISPYVAKTPMLRLKNLDAYLGCEVYVKAECMQNAGSFKLRGAMNKALSLSREELDCGIVAASSGNHGRAISFAGQMLGAKVTVVMPNTAPAIKVKNVKALGAEVVQCENSERFVVADKVCAERGATLVPPFNDEDVMCGQGTVGLEILEQLPEVNKVISPVSGGGLLGGLATAIRESTDKVEVYGAESAVLPRWSVSLAAGTPTKVEQQGKNLADALMAQIPGELCWPYVAKNAAGVAAVDNEYLLKAWKLLLMEGKVLCEPSSAIGLAAVLQGLVPVKPTDKVCFLVSGGNVAFEQLKVFEEVEI